jgi:hypothetical protein
MMFHVATAGQCWLEVEGANSCHLRPGDLALVPHGEGHRLVGAAGVTAVKLFDAPRELVSDRYEILPAWRRRRIGDGHLRRRSLRSPGGASSDSPAA